MNDSSSLGPEAARERAKEASRAGLKVVRLLDAVLDKQPAGTCLALQYLKRTLRAAQLNPLSLIETPQLNLALTQLRIVDDGDDPRVSKLAMNLELYLALRRCREASDAASDLDADSQFHDPDRHDFAETVIDGLEVAEGYGDAAVSRFDDAPFVNYPSTRFGYLNTQGGHPSHSRSPRPRHDPLHLDFEDTVQEFPRTVPAALL